MHLRAYEVNRNTYEYINTPDYENVDFRKSMLDYDQIH